MRTFLLSLIVGFSFPSLIQAQCCDHHLVMQDAYGDGWNGGHLEIFLNNTSIGVFAATGTGSSSTFTVCDGDSLRLFYTAADWENENTYQLYGPYGDVIFTNGPNPTIGLVYNDTIACGVQPAAGNVPCTALPIDTVDCIIVDNTGVTGTSTNPGCANYTGGDLWYVMPMPPSGNVSVSTSDAGGLNDTGVALWTGPDCFNLIERACNDDNGINYFSLVNAYELPTDQNLYIQVFGYGGGAGAFQLCVTDLGVVTLDSTELPIVLLQTDGADIPYTGKIPAHMEIKYNGPGTITHLTDPSNVYNGHIGIGLHGATSAGYPQHPYSIETQDSTGANNNVELLGMPAENDWLLLSNYNDRSLIRNALSFHLARSMGDYASRAHLCEVLLDSAYRGIYLFAERIKRDNNRLHIAKLTPTDNAGDSLTGGYILQQNLWDAANSFQSNYSPVDHPGFDVHFLYEYPAFDVITPQQKVYIADYVDSLETALYSADFIGPEGYRKFLDVPSFINYFIVNELARNADGFKKSVFFNKDKYSNGGKLKAGPVWDFDWGWKNIWGCSVADQTDGSQWAHHVNDCPTDNYSTGWYIRLLQDSTFTSELRCTYEDYRNNLLDTTNLFAYMDSVHALVQHAQERHFRKWQLLGVSGPAPEVLAVAATYAAELDTLKHWVRLRLDWLDANIPGLCSHVGVVEPTKDHGITVFPNPSSGMFSFRGNLPVNGSSQLVITDITGRSIERSVLPAGRIVVDVELKMAGAYFYSIVHDGRLLEQGKLIVQ